MKFKRMIIILVACILFFIPLTIGMTGSALYITYSHQPDFSGVTLWKYDSDKSRANYDYFWTANNPSKYIMPENPIIQYFANNTGEIQIDYSPDPVDYWQNPDYTLKIMKGDCEDETFVWVSVHRAKGHKAVVVGGYLYFDDGTFIRDFWYEYMDNNIHQTKYVTPVVSLRRFYSKPLFMFNDKMSIKGYDPDWMNE